VVPVPGDLAASLRRHVALANLAAEEGAEVVVFPELSLTGYELSRAAELALSPGDGRLDGLRRWVEASKTTLIVGAPIRDGGDLYLGAFVLLPTGEELVHQKRFLGTFGEEARVDGELPPPEPEVFAVGQLAPLVPLRAGPGAVAICAEGNRLEHAALASARGARVYLSCSFVIPSEFEAATQHLQQRAAQHDLLVVFANFGGPSGGMRSAGGSSIWSPGGTLLGRLPSSGEGVLLADGGSGGFRSWPCAVDGVLTDGQPSARSS